MQYLSEGLEKGFLLRWTPHRIQGSSFVEMFEVVGGGGAR